MEGGAAYGGGRRRKQRKEEEDVEKRNGREGGNRIRRKDEQMNGRKLGRCEDERRLMRSRGKGEEKCETKTRAEYEQKN